MEEFEIQEEEFYEDQPDSDIYGEDPVLEEGADDVTDGTDGSGQEEGQEPEADASDEESVTESEGEAGDIESEEQTEGSEEVSGETVSGNDIVEISGDVIVFPEGFDFSILQDSSVNDTADTGTVEELIREQTGLILGVSVVSVFLLGVIAGILFIQGFRIRRV